ncbi:hypothetical protein PC116_g32198 [Phytophthora cactorum]|nr:hypothetical protein PC116_g32198 [Phytophthora cactorum]
MGHALTHLVQERDVLFVFDIIPIATAVNSRFFAAPALGSGKAHVDVLAATREAVSDAGEVLVVSDEEGEAAGVLDDVLEDGVGDGGAVVGARAAAELVEDDQGAGGGGAEDARGLGDLDHEGGFAGEEVIAGAHARVYGVGEGQGQRGGGYEGADLGEEHEERDGADEGGFTAHVGSGDEVG